MRFWSVELVLRASEMCSAPSGPMLLPQSLRVRADSECQRLLTLSESEHIEGEHWVRDRLLTVEKGRADVDSAVRGCAYLRVSRFGIAPLAARWAITLQSAPVSDLQLQSNSTAPSSSLIDEPTFSKNASSSAFEICSSA